MINIKVDGLAQVKSLLKIAPKQTIRAAEMALDYTAKWIKSDVQKEMLTAFDRPTPYTINSLYLTLTQGHNLKAQVWFKDPDRMGQHYLVPQVEGGARKLKGFERAFGTEYVPGSGAKLDQYGNIPGSTILQIMSVLGKLNRYAGDNTNITARSRKRNARERDYVYLPKGSGKMPPGIYQRTQTGVGFGAKTKRTFADRSRSYQKGRTRGQFSSVIRARGLKPILVTGRTGHTVRPLLDFYGIAGRTFDREFSKAFSARFERLMASRS